MPEVMTLSITYLVPLRDSNGLISSEVVASLLGIRRVELIPSRKTLLSYFTPGQIVFGCFNWRYTQLQVVKDDSNNNRVLQHLRRFSGGASYATFTKQNSIILTIEDIRMIESDCFYYREDERKKRRRIFFRDVDISMLVE